MTINNVLNIADYFLDTRITKGYGEKIALFTDNNIYTYNNIQKMANRYANYFIDQGIQCEQRVLIALPNIIETVAAFFGATKVGAVAVLINPKITTDLVNHFLAYTRAKISLFTEEDYTYHAASPEFNSLIKELMLVNSKRTQAILESKNDIFENFLTHKDDPCVWFFSGGTTGKPKAVVQTHGSIINSNEAYGKGVLHYKQEDTVLSTSKLFFGYALGSSLLFPFSVGASIILSNENSTSETIAKLSQRFCPSVLITVPTIINRILNDDFISNKNLSSLRLVTTAGEILPIQLYNAWKAKFNVPLLDGLGTAEMWHIFISNHLGKERAGTLGTVVNGFEVKVCDDTGNELPSGTPGWLWVKGKSRALGYWQDLEKTMKTFKGEWCITGDIVLQDKEGYFIYFGRGDDIVKVSGKWLSMHEIERSLEQHSDILEAVVVAVPNQTGLIKPYACVVKKPASKVQEADIKNYLSKALERYKIPRKIYFDNQLPKTHLGKINRGGIRSFVEQQINKTIEDNK